MNRRSLLQSGADAFSRDVANATQLYQAIEDGVKRIHITNHLDMTELQNVLKEDEGNTTLPDITTTEAIWVRAVPTGNVGLTTEKIVLSNYVCVWDPLCYVSRLHCSSRCFSQSSSARFCPSDPCTTSLWKAAQGQHGIHESGL